MIIQLKDRLNIPVNQLQKFIEDYLERTEMSRRALALRMGVADTTVGDVLKKEKAAFPSVDFLIKLAQATDSDIREIIVLVSPDEVVKGSTSEAASLAVRIAKLTDDELKLIDRYITGAQSQLDKSDDNIKSP